MGWQDDAIVDATTYRSPTATGPISTTEAVLGGGKHAWDKLAMGLKSVFTQLTPEDRQLLLQGQDFVKEAGLPAKAAELATEVGATAPAAVLTPLRLLPLALGAQGYVTQPGSTSEKLKSAGTQAAIGLAGPVLQKALGNLAGARDPLIRELAGTGAVTVGQAASLTGSLSGRAANWVERNIVGNLQPSINALRNSNAKGLAGYNALKGTAGATQLPQGATDIAAAGGALLTGGHSAITNLVAGSPTTHKLLLKALHGAGDVAHHGSGPAARALSVLVGTQNQVPSSMGVTLQPAPLGTGPSRWQNDQIVGQ